ncbi:MAG TPA: hypothetical protein VEP90_06980 [Methylomirabilota bacterium]|nr:hypothetical protein [Methylomirabilota bacterium]
MTDSYHCPDCPQEGEVPPANYNLRLLTNNAEVQAAFPDAAVDNSSNTVLRQVYCYPHYVAAYNRFQPAGGISQQWKSGDVKESDPDEKFDPNQGILPA